MLQNLEKEYFSVPELVKRWNYDESDVCALIWRGDLVPSWYFSEYDSYPIYELTVDDEINGLTGVAVEGHVAGVEGLTEIFSRQEGFKYLILPKRPSPTTCDFWLFSITSGPFSAGDCVQHLPSPISLLDVREHGVVMLSEIEKYEKLLCVIDPLAFQTRQIKPISRFAAQETFVLKTIDILGVDPMQLPKHQPGKAGLKAKIRQLALAENKIFTGGKVFEKTWERLLVRRDIVYKK